MRERQTTELRPCVERRTIAYDPESLLHPPPRAAVAHVADLTLGLPFIGHGPGVERESSFFALLEIKIDVRGR
jgi:hypothetical protein